MAIRGLCEHNLLFKLLIFLAVGFSWYRTRRSSGLFVTSVRHSGNTYLTWIRMSQATLTDRRLLSEMRVPRKRNDCRLRI